MLLNFHNDVFWWTDVFKLDEIQFICFFSLRVILLCPKITVYPRIYPEQKQRKDFFLRLVVHIDFYILPIVSHLFHISFLFRFLFSTFLIVLITKSFECIYSISFYLEKKSWNLENIWKPPPDYMGFKVNIISKPQWSTISRQSEWLRSKSLQAINAGEGVEKREPSYTVGGNAN